MRAAKVQAGRCQKVSMATSRFRYKEPADTENPGVGDYDKAYVRAAEGNKKTVRQSAGYMLTELYCLYFQ
jgi:hypothetical protein